MRSRVRAGFNSPLSIECIIFSQGILFGENERNCYSPKVEFKVEQKSPLSTNDSSSVRAWHEGQKVRNSNGPMNRSAELGTEGIAPRPTSLNILNHVNLKEETSSTSKTETSVCGYDLKPCVPEQARTKNLDVSKESRASCGFKSHSHNFHTDDTSSRKASDLGTKQSDPPVCRDCCNSLRAVEDKLVNLSTSLEKLETKLSADVASIFEILRADSHQRPRDFQTQV